MGVTRAGTGRPWAAATAVVLASLVVAAGCQPGVDPTPDPVASTTTETISTPPTQAATEDPTPAAGPAPEVEPPAFPEGADVDDHVGAALFATYFLDLYGYIRTTGDLAPWDAVVSPECGWCAEVRSIVVRVHEDDRGWIEGDGPAYDFDSATISLPDSNNPHYVVALAITEQPFVLHLPDATREWPGSTYDGAQIAVEYIGGRFLVIGVALNA